MAIWRHAVELAMTDEEIGRLMAISRSRTEAASRVMRAQMFFCDRAQTWWPSSDRPALRRAGCGLWSARGTR
jgi:hypothetical protein